MYPKDDDRFEACINSIKNLCNELDFLASPTIEKRMRCSLDCCIGNSRLAKTLIDCAGECKEIRFLLGDEGLQPVRQRQEMFDDILYQSEYEKGFSKTQHGLTFIVFVNKVNTVLKDAIKRYEAITKNNK